jgi:hypothetical protein
LEVDSVSNVNILASGRDVSLEATVLGNTTSDGTVDLAWERWDLIDNSTDGELTSECISTSKLNY